MVGLEIVSAGKQKFCLTCVGFVFVMFFFFLNTKTKSHSSYCSFPIHLDDGFNKKQRHLKAQAFAIKMRPRKETLEVNFVSVISSFHCVQCQN